MCLYQKLISKLTYTLKKRSFCNKLSEKFFIFYLAAPRQLWVHSEGFLAGLSILLQITSSSFWLWSNSLMQKRVRGYVGSPIRLFGTFWNPKISDWNTFVSPEFQNFLLILEFAKTLPSFMYTTRSTTFYTRKCSFTFEKPVHRLKNC